LILQSWKQQVPVSTVDYESSALPAELPRRAFIFSYLWADYLFSLPILCRCRVEDAPFAQTLLTAFSNVFMAAFAFSDSTTM
jgi:hypothetical protein